MIDEQYSRSGVALVTGSSKGIGAAIVRRLAPSFGNIIIHGRDESPQLLKVVDEIRETGCKVSAITCDFSNGNLNEFCQQCWQEFGNIDLLVNNAGGDVLTGVRSEEKFEDKLDYLLRVDVVATLQISRAIGQRMFVYRSEAEKKRQPGCIINMGWDQAWQGMAGDSGEMFSTTKGAIMSMSKSLAQTLAPFVRVNCVAPGWIKTEWGDTASPDWQQRAVNESLMNRWGTPEDVASAVALLASEDSSFVTGQIIPVNGGFRYHQQSDD